MQQIVLFSWKNDKRKQNDSLQWFEKKFQEEGKDAFQLIWTDN